MRRRFWVLLLLCLAGLSPLISPLTNAGSTLRVDEAATRFLFERERTGASLALENPLGHSVTARIRIELIDPQGLARATSERIETIKAGQSLLFIPLAFQPGEIKPTERSQLIWYRLRYAIAAGDPAEKIERIEGILSLSEIAQDLFEVQVVASTYARESSLYRAHVRAAHPVSGHPIAGVSIEGQISIDREKEDKDPTKLRASAVTDKDGYAALDFALPANVKANDADIEIIATRGTLVQRAEDSLHFDQMSRLFITTDKPLYQPGQTLHARVLVFSPSMHAIANSRTPFKIEDPEGTVVFRSELQTSRFGIASVDWPIPENTRLGEYTVAFGREDDSYASYRVKISRYDLPNFTTSIKPDRQYYLPRQNASVEVRAEYLFGQPVKRGRVRVVRESEREWNYREQKWDTTEGETFEGETDGEGRFIAKISLGKEHEKLEESEWSQFEDITYAAYFTDTSTGRTEQRRFALRVTKEPIHIYVIGDTYNQSSRLPLEFYVSTFYADGRPAQCDVLVSKGSKEDDEYRAPKDWTGGKQLASFRTSAYGLAKVTNLKPPKSDDRVYLRFAARDLKGGSGHKNVNFYYEDKPAIRVRTNKSLYRPGDPLTINIVSSEKDVNAIVDVSKDWQVLHSQRVHLRDGRASITLPYDNQFKDELVVSAYVSLDAREAIHDSHVVMYPRDKDLRLDVRPGQSTYRPGEEAHVDFNVGAPDGRVTESALGVVVFDRAVEERARADQEFGSAYSAYGNYGGLLGWDESVGGVTRKDLEKLDLTKPLPEGLELLAEVLLNRNSGYDPNTFGVENYDLDQTRTFAALTNAQVKPLQDALAARYSARMEYPADEAGLRRILSEAGIAFDAVLDPWGTRYRAEFYIQNENDVLKLVSAGADKRFDTTDDFSVAVLSWPYFRPTGETIDRAVWKFHARTGGYIRDHITLQRELFMEGVNFFGLRDPWGKPYRVGFGVSGVHYVLSVSSGGPNQKFEQPLDSPTDDFLLWTSMSDYFAESRTAIGAALNTSLKAGLAFPQSAKELSEALAQYKIDLSALRDPFGRAYYSTVKTESRFSDRVRIESRSQYGAQAKAQTDIKPVTQTVGIVSLRSAGADGKEGTADDFDVASYTLILGEQTRDDKARLTVRGAPILTGDGGAVTGTITDPNGGVVPNTTVRATLSNTTQFSEATSDDAGRYAISNLPPGMYEIHIEPSAGFMGFTMTNVLVRASNITEVDITLQVGAQTMSVTVTSGAEAQVDTANFSLRSTSNNFLLSKRELVNVITKSGTRNPSPEASTPRLREYFPETLLWQPLLVTDAQGRAELRFKLADNITTWKLAVIGSTTNGEIGMAEKEILAFQPFFVEHDPPRVLTEGDEIQLPVVLRNYLDKPQSVDVEIKPESWFTLLGPSQKRAQVAAGDNSRQTFDFRAISTIKDGKQRITAKASTTSDQIEKPVTVHPDGEEIAKTTSGILADTTTLESNIPLDAIKGTARAELKVYPNLMAHVVESIEGIMRRPYGCAEQTISAAYPSLLALRVYKQTGKESPVTAKARRYVQSGYERLLNYRTTSGGFSYWGRGDADLALTAFALKFLHDAQEFTDVDPSVISEARNWLVKQQRGDGSWPARVWWETVENKQRTSMLTAYIARVLASTKTADSTAQSSAANNAGLESSAALKRSLIYLSERSQEIDEPYMIASYALSALDAGEIDGARSAIEKLRSLAHEEGGMTYWSLETNTPFYGWGLAGRIETTALVLQALNKAMMNDKRGMMNEKPSSSDSSSFIVPHSSLLVDRGLLFLLRQQDRYGVWYSTQATVNTLETLVSLLSESSRRDGAPTAATASSAQVFVNGKVATTIQMPGDGLLASPIVTDISQYLAPGDNHVEIRRSPGSARASVQVVSSYYSPWTGPRMMSHAGPEESASALRLGVNYSKSVADVGDEITCSVNAERVGFKGYGMLLGEIGLPPGADVDRASLERAMTDSGWSLSQYDILPDRLVVYLWPHAGGTRFEFKFRTRFGLTAQTAPSLLYDYYNPEARVVVPPTKFVVK